RSPDFLDAAKQPTITFKSTGSKCAGTNDYDVTGNLTIRAVTRPVAFNMHYLGKWPTPYWTDKGDAGPATRIGFTGETRINRHDFGVSWQGEMQNKGVVVSDDVIIKLDIEAMLETELQRALKK